MKTTKDPHFGYLGVLNLDFFGTMRLFFKNFFDCTKGSLFIFLKFLEHNRCLKIPKGPPFQIFRHYETVQNCHFSSDLRFSQYISTNIFYNTTRNLNVVSGVKRSIRSFDVIAQVYSVSLRGGGCSKTSARICPSRYIRTSEAFSQHGRLPLSETFL